LKIFIIDKFIKEMTMKLNAAKLSVGLVISLFMCFSFSTMAQSVKDIDGNEYKTIKYGLQEWMAENLNVSHFRNGDIIPEAKTKKEWISLGNKGKPAWCFFENDPENGKIYGKLYNWYAINDSRGLAPEGWNIPANQDWMTLVKNLLGIDVAGLKLKSNTRWKSNNGTNKIGFSALPAGSRNIKADFKGLETKCQLWSNSEPVEVQKSDLIYSFVLNDFTMEVGYIKMEKGNGLSVRCVRNFVK
jgi:uncharacterized protein (TIGR02145 family)